MTSVPALCGVSAGLLHYFMLVFFSWTAVESVFLFMKLVRVVGSEIHWYTLKAGLLAWSKKPLLKHCYSVKCIAEVSTSCVLVKQFAPIFKLVAKSYV